MIAQDKTNIFQLRIQPGLKAGLCALAKKRGVSASELIRRFIIAGMALETAQPVADSVPAAGSHHQVAWNGQKAS